MVSMMEWFSLSEDKCAGTANALKVCMVVTIKGMEIPDSREFVAFCVAKTTVRGEEG